MKKKFKIPKVTIGIKMSCKTDECYQITSPTDTVELLRDIFSNNDILFREQMILLLLNRANRVVGYSEVSIGGVSGTVCDPKVVFITALNSNASNIILSHNHPSGNTKPSQADIDITNKINDAAKLLDMQLLDHIILTDNNHYSFADNGILNK